VTINVKQRIASLDAWARPSPRKYNVCWCEGLLRSLLVTPSVVRDVRDANLLGIWKAALEDLRMADEWIFVGYSLPAEDISIRSLLLRAWHARRRTRLRVKVVQFERNAADDCTPSATFSRYRMFFPSTALKETDYSRGGVQEFIDSLELLPEKQLGARLRKYLGGWSDAQIAAREREKRLMREEKALSKKRRRKRS
jgi:hypothetical protein